jgi:hypothetical protein
MCVVVILLLKGTLKEDEVLIWGLVYGSLVLGLYEIIGLDFGFCIRMWILIFKGPHLNFGPRH